MKEETFWVVWNPYSGNPQMRHSHEYLATDEAKRLAAKQPGSLFFVLKATHKVQVQEPVTITKLA